MSVSASSRPTILVVEDNYFVAREVCEIVRDCGYDVAGPVRHVAQGVELLAGRPIDGAIVDIRLGNALSYPICRELARRHVPFVFLTACERGVIPASFGQVPVLSKPAQREEIRTVLAGLADWPLS
jgi:CheY-like chemotaxis protein